MLIALAALKQPRQAPSHSSGYVFFSGVEEISTFFVTATPEPRGLHVESGSRTRSRDRDRPFRTHSGQPAQVNLHMCGSDPLSAIRATASASSQDPRPLCRNRRVLRASVRVARAAPACQPGHRSAQAILSAMLELLRRPGAPAWVVRHFRERARGWVRGAKITFPIPRPASLARQARGRAATGVPGCARHGWRAARRPAGGQASPSSPL